MTPRGAALFSFLLILLIFSPVAAETQPAKSAPSIGDKFNKQINTQCKKGQGIGYNDNKKAHEKYCPTESAPDPKSKSTWLFRLFSRSNQMAAATAATCQESEKLENYFWVECSGDQDGIAVKGYCEAPEKCHATDYKDKDGKYKPIDKPFKVACDTSVLVTDCKTGQPTKAKAEPVQQNQTPQQPAKKSVEQPAEQQPVSKGDGSTATKSQPAPVAEESKVAETNTNTGTQEQAPLAKANQELLQEGSGSGGGGEQLAGGGSRQPVQDLPQPVMNESLKETAGLSSPTPAPSAGPAGGSAAPTSVQNTNTVQGGGGGGGGTGGGSGPIASTQGAPTTGSTFSSPQPVGSPSSASQPTGGFSSAFNRTTSAFSSASQGIGSFVGGMASFVTNFASAVNGGGGGGPAFFSPPVDLTLGQGQSSLGQPRMQQGGVAPTQTLPAAYQPQSASSRQGSIGGTPGQSSFAGLQKPVLLDSLPDWAGDAVGNGMPLLMSLGGDERGGAIADTAGRKGVGSFDEGESGGQVGTRQGGPAGSGRSVAGGQGVEQGAGQGAGQNADQRADGKPGSPSGSARGEGGAGLEDTGRPFGSSDGGDAFFDAQGPGSFGEAMKTIQEKLFVKGIGAAAHSVWKFFQDAVGCQIAGGCEEEEGIMMVGRAPMLLTGDAVVNAFKSYGNDLPSPAVVSQIAITGKRPVGIVERAAPLLSVVGDGVRTIQSFFGFGGLPKSALSPERIPGETVRVTRESKADAAFGSAGVKQPGSRAEPRADGVLQPGVPSAVPVAGGAAVDTGATSTPSVPAHDASANLSSTSVSETPSDEPIGFDTMTDTLYEDADLTPVEWFGSVLEERVTKLQALVARVTNWFAGLFL